MLWRMAFLLGLVLGGGMAVAQDFTTLKGHGGPIMGIAVSPEGRVATASFDNSVGLWEARVPTWLEGHDAAVVTVRWDAATLLSGGDDFTVRRWSIASGAAEVIGRHKGKVADIAADGSGRVASASWDGSIGLWPEGRMLKGHGAGVNAVLFGPDDTLYSASADGSIRIWDLAAGREDQRLVSHGFGVNRIVLDADAGWLAYGAVDGGTRVVDARSGAPIADFTLDRRPILAMAYHRDSGQLAVGDGQGYIMVLDTRDWRITRDFRATRQGPVWALAFSVDGSVIHAGGLDDVVYAWPVALLDAFDPVGGEPRSFLRAADTMPNGERQFMRKCSICHALEPGPSRKAGPTLFGLFGRRAGTVDGYSYSPTLNGAQIVWTEETVDALFDQGPDHYIPGSKMPMQVIAGDGDRADLIAFLKTATQETSQ